MKTAFIQLGRYGDICNILPLCKERADAGNRVSVYVRPEFADLLEVVSYVHPVVWNGPTESVRSAYEHAKDHQYHEVFATQIYANFTKPTKRYENFTLEQWGRAGNREQLYHQLPLVFDRRDDYGERLAISKLIPRTTKPILGHCLSGFSSPFDESGKFAAWLVEEFGDEYEIVDLCKEQLPAVHHLLGPMESCSVLICSDSLPLHLSYAVGRPVIALHADRDSYYHSEPRKHWLASMTYKRANDNKGKYELISILKHCEKYEAAEPITHVVDWFEPQDPEHRRRLEESRTTWQRLAEVDKYWATIYPTLSRSSKDLGDSRSCPFIRDLLDSAAEVAGSGIVVLTNSDSRLTEDAGEMIRRKLGRGPCCYSKRVDIDKGESGFTQSWEMSGRSAYLGLDLFACRGDWWKQHRDEYPDFLSSSEGWDGVLRFLFDRHNPASELMPPVVFHEAHANFWSRPENVLDSMGQRWNRAQATIWMMKNGKSHLFGKGACLIK